MTMRAGNLSSIICIETPKVETDDFGANRIQWVQFVSKSRARVSYSSGSRVNENNEITFAYEVIFTIRHYHKVNERMRILWEGRKYRILSIERNKALQQITIKTELINE